MEKWHDLFVATAGSTAALTGLIFVAVSINLDRILAFPRLAERALISLILLLTVMIVSVIMLIPDLEWTTYGIVLLLLSLLVLLIVARIDILIYSRTERIYKKRYGTMVMLNQVAILPYFVSATLLYFTYEEGMFWIVGGFFFCVVKAVIDAWVLLIEINR
jgi:hypothetical protein